MSKRDIPTYCDCPQGNELIQHHLHLITEHILALDLPIRSLIIAGSFGRGEGVVAKDESGKMYPVNDYDVVIALSQKLKWHQRMDLRLLRESLPAELGIWHLDFNCMDTKELTSPTMSMMRYDMKFGSRVFFGEQDVLELIPFKQSDPISQAEILNLLINRMVTLLEGHPQVPNGLSPEIKQRQVVKVFFALCDSALNEYKCYVTHYKKKLDALRNMEDSSDLISYLREFEDTARTAWRMEAKELTTSQLHKFWDASRKQLVHLIQSSIETMVSGTEEQQINLLEYWRAERDARKSPLARFIGLLRGKGSREEAEKKVFMLLKTYPREDYFHELQLTIPECSSPLEENGRWSSLAQQLIQSWYHSV